MGRMFEAFKLLDPNRVHTIEAPAGPHPAWPRPASPAPPPADEEVPFIEVGGSRTSMEASPQVLAAGAKLGPKPMLTPAGPQLRAVAPAVSGDEPTRILSVALRPAS